MADLYGTIVASPILPSSTRDTHPTHEATYGKGGHRTVAGMSALYAIPESRREVGMTVFVETASSEYRLIGGISNHNWVQSEEVSGDTLSEEDRLKLDSIEVGAEKNTVHSVHGKMGEVLLDKADIGLENVDNTADEDKHVASASIANRVTHKLIVNDQEYDGSEKVIIEARPVTSFDFICRASSVIDSLKVVRSVSNDEVDIVDNTSSDDVHNIFGVSITKAGSVGSDLVVRTVGVVEDNSLSLSLGKVWLGVGGSLTQTPPTSGYNVVIGVAIAPNKLNINVQEPIRLL